MNVKPNTPSIHSHVQQSPIHNFDKKTFDDYAELYEKMFALPYRQHLELPTLDALLGELSGVNILDFGCGTGFFSRWAHDKGAGKVVGYDISEGMLSYARYLEEISPRGISYFSVLDDNLSELFDIVLAVYVMPYAPNKEKLLEMGRTMARLLKPGGRLITLPINPDFHHNPEYYRSYGLRLWEKEPRTDGSAVNLNICQPPYDINIEAYYWSKETLKDVLTQVGFHQISWKEHLPPDSSSPISPVSLDDYLKTPHAAIIEGVKATT